jgi:hypothetical protein
LGGQSKKQVLEPVKRNGLPFVLELAGARYPPQWLFLNQK